ncbi:hypothetical protein BS47DRAFT_1365853 [Hydnum rufescens UP504]|uniref:Uncharacterized protein n=1 Tax=Hydnum rufescens UP504 TaxID=1448309 RepID=A0A9P6AML8_9AGAM|nr:hypothetical protein BS47DRAFT_1365853 [Hydnum rufescens UP504]
MTHPNRHPPVCKAKYKAHGRGAKSVPHTCFSMYIRFLPSMKTHLTTTWASPQYVQPPKPKEPAPQNDNQQTCVPHTHQSGFLPPVKTHLMSTQASPQYMQPPKQRGPAPQTWQLMKPHTTHPLQQVCGNTLPSPSMTTPTQKRDVRSHLQPGRCVVILSLSSGPNTHNPAE